MIKAITLNSPEEVRKVSEIASEQPFDVYVSCGHLILDAKSLLALFALIGRKNVYLVAPDHLKASKFFEVIKQMGF